MKREKEQSTRYLKNLNSKLESISLPKITSYINANTKVDIICVCGHRIFRTPDKILRTINLTGTLLCDPCGRIEQGRKRVEQKKQIIKDEIASYGATLIEDYCDANIPLKIHGQCGHYLERRIGYVRSRFKQDGTLLCRKCGYTASGIKGRNKKKDTLKQLESLGVTVNENEIVKEQDWIEVVGSCGHKFTTKLCRLKRKGLTRDKVQCPSCSRGSRSFGEESLSYFIKSMGVSVEDNYVPSGLGRKLEVDIFVPSKNIAIEYNGLNWHSERILAGKYKSPTKYHIKKSMFFYETLNINVIHVMEHEWRNNRPIIESIIRAKLGKSEHKIAARKCNLSIVDKKEAAQFLSNNHRQGSCPSAVAVGLWYKGELVSVMTIGSARFSKKYDTELLRFASKLNTSVIGGFSRLLNFASSVMELGIMVSYADVRFSSVNPENTVYSKHGFKHLGISNPNYFYFKRGSQDVVFSRISFQKHKLADKLENFNANETEYQNMINHGYDRFWDCGNHIFVREYSAHHKDQN